MDMRKKWREQELQLVERWRVATDRFRDAQAAVALQNPPQGDGSPSEDSVQAVEAARCEVEVVRKQVARLKVEFSAGKRY